MGNAYLGVLEMLAADPHVEVVSCEQVYSRFGS
jgi:hypothetical protein